MSEATIETDRLILLRPRLQHLERYRAYCASDRARFVGGPFDADKALEKLRAMTEHWALRGFGRYVITLKTTGAAIGHVGALQTDDAAAPEMTWTLWTEAAEGQGYAFEAAQAYLARADIAIGAQDLIARIDARNTRSRALALRLGASLDARAPAPRSMPNAVTYRVPTGGRC